MLLPMLSHLTDAKYCFEIGDAALIDNPSKSNGLVQRWFSIPAPKASELRVQVQSAVLCDKKPRSTATKPVQQMISIFQSDFDAARNLTLRYFFACIPVRRQSQVQDQ